MLSATGPPNLPPSRPHLLTTVGFPILKTLLRQIDAKRTRHGGGVVARDPRAYMPPPHPPPPLPATSPFLFEDVPHDPLPPLGSTCRTSPTWRLQNHQLSNTADPCDSGDFPPEGIDIAAVGAGPRAQPHHTTPQGGAGGGQPHHTTGGGGGREPRNTAGLRGYQPLMMMMMMMMIIIIMMMMMIILGAAGTTTPHHRGGRGTVQDSAGTTTPDHTTPQGGRRGTVQNSRLEGLPTIGGGGEGGGTAEPASYMYGVSHHRMAVAGFAPEV